MKVPVRYYQGYNDVTFYLKVVLVPIEVHVLVVIAVHDSVVDVRR